MSKPDNVFSEKSNEKLNVKRNAYDKSFQNNLTMKFGIHYPCYVKETMPNESVSIKPTLGLNFMPMVFPVQTKMYVNMSFFYVRYRALWKDWQDFITNVKDGLVPPFIARDADGARKFFSTGSLADYMNIPTQADVNSYVDRIYTHSNFLSDASNWYRFSYYDRTQEFGVFIENGDVITVTNDNDNNPLYFGDYYVFNNALSYIASFENMDQPDTNQVFERYFGYINDDRIRVLVGRFLGPDASGLSSGNFFDGTANIRRLFTDYWNDFYNSDFQAIAASSSAGVLLPLNNLISSLPTAIDNNQYIFDLLMQQQANFDIDRPTPVYLNGPAYITAFDVDGNQLGFIPGTFTAVPITDAPFWTDSQTTNGDFVLRWRPDSIDDYNSFVGSCPNYARLCLVCPISNNIVNPFPFRLNSGLVTPTSEVVFSGMYRINSERLDTSTSVLPYAMGTSDVTDPNSMPATPISAFPFRAYESIYNAYYRRQQIDEFTINGVPEPNKWITSNDGGPDTVDYKFYYRDWEPDFLTTAFPSPQQGDAPLVGSVGSQRLFVTDSNGNTFGIDTILGEDGETITGISGYDEGTPIGSVHRLMSQITSGISINDFRLTNSLQRYLERSLRAGYRYRDLMRAHHGVNIKYNPLDMPEFIGGFTDIVDVNKIVNQSALEGGSPLGAFAGLASAFKQSKHNISCFSDEHGLVMGIVSVVPIPTYTQVLDKFFTKRHFLDYYNPEFSRIGMQPITYNEVSPILRYNESVSDASLSVHDTFGYQKAWYEYMSNLDQAHGEFRASLRNFVMYRLFGSSPFLGKDFIHVKETDLNNVFAYTEQSDKILGQIYFSVRSKLPVMRHMVPGLE